MIRGIGPVYAKKLLRAFGDKVFDVIEAEPDRLREVDCIGPVQRTASLLPGLSRRSSERSWSFCIATGSARRGQCASTGPMAPTPCRSCRKIPTGWPATFAASASGRPTPSP